ncbi:hypothetical protein [Streptomyces sp. NPDC050388]|uniref:hypothetical protein n=1 Tax=Streptomyces sp. NPDC050388 TaxID=3155781 RepID=UPI00341DFF6B
MKTCEDGKLGACSGVFAVVPTAAGGGLAGMDEEQGGESEGGGGERGDGDGVVGEASGERGAGSPSDAD